MRKVLVLGLLFGIIAAVNTACSGDDDDDDEHAVPNSITISGGTSVIKDSSLQLTATGNYDGGVTDDLTATSTWTSSSSGVATVGATGLVTGISVGTTTIMAEHDEVVGQITLTVTTAGAAFNATVTGDWSSAHGNGVPIFIRIVDTSTSDVVFCVDDEVTEMGAAAGQLNATAPGVLLAGHTYRAEAIADVGGNVGGIDGGDHKYMSANVGPIAANATLDVPHSGVAPSWTGAPCP